MKLQAIIATVIITILVLAALAAAFVASGAHDVGADSPPTGFVASVLVFARERSIDVRTQNIEAPPLDNPAMIAKGVLHYAAMCTGCHLAPGMRETELRTGLDPQPPVLASLPRGNPAEQFWFVKHGVQMTAMPAWGKTHSDAEIWDIVAFLQKLPDLSAAQYRALEQNAAMHNAPMKH